MFLVFLIGTLSSLASASVPNTKYSAGSRELVESLDVAGLTGHQLQMDPHPFSTEFYLHQFAAEPGFSDARRQRSFWRAPVTTAASGLSKRVASLRRALVRMMP